MPLAALTNPDLYLEQIEHLRRRHGQRRMAERLAREGLSISTVTTQSTTLARLIVEDISAARYEFGTVTAARAVIEGKRRTLYRAGFVDTVVLGVLAKVLARAVQHGLSDHLYSYRIGYSPWSAMADLSDYLRRHIRTVERKQRGLYVIRRDVRRYGESIPVTNGAPLWGILRAATGLTVDAPHWRLLRAAIRPAVVHEDGDVRPLDLGVPTGSPLQPTVCNVYLACADELGESFAAGFYARFGDDILFAHPDSRKATRFATDLAGELSTLGLRFKDSKSQDLYVTEPGRPPPERLPFQSARHIDYLGCRISFSGTVGLNGQKSRRLLRDVRTRLRHTNRSLSRVGAADRAMTLCAVANRALEADLPVADRHAAWLRTIVDDRAQLGQLDYLIALEIAQLASGRRGVRAFRQFPPRRLRNRCGLRSLVAARNRTLSGGKGA